MKQLKELFKVGGTQIKKTIKGYENYSISSNGVVKNERTNKIKIPTSNYSGKGYLYVDLYNKGKKKRFYIHRLVAQYFISNKENKPYVNHKDGNPKNNTVENLEWCTPLENVIHASKIIKTMKQYEIANNNRKKSIYQIDLNTNKIINSFNSIREAERGTGIPSSNIIGVLKHRQNRTKSYTWQYIESLEEN